MFALETRRLASANRSHISFHVAKFLATAGGMVNLVKIFLSMENLVVSHTLCMHVEFCNGSGAKKLE